MKDAERDLMRKIILEMILKGHVHWTDLKKRVLGTCHPFATDSTFADQIRYLLGKRFIERKGRGIYWVTEKGKQYLQVI